MENILTLLAVVLLDKNKVELPIANFSSVKRDGLWVAIFDPLCQWKVKDKK